MTDQKLCFVIGPIGAHKSDDRVHADRLLKLVIKPTFRMNFRDYKVERADEISKPGMIDSQVISHLIEADIVIADLTTRNANAFYELGIRHILQRPVIHMFRRGDPPPADVAPYRGIEFSYDGKWEIRDAKVALRKAVAEVINPAFQIENPVTRAKGFIRLKQEITNERKRANQFADGIASPLFKEFDSLMEESLRKKTLPTKKHYMRAINALERFEEGYHELKKMIDQVGLKWL